MTLHVPIYVMEIIIHQWDPTSWDIARLALKNCKPS